MPDALSDAKAALAHANAAFPSPKAAPAAPAAPAKATPTLGDELNAKAGMVQKGRQALGAPKMHSGGPVLSDGTYQLQAGEHVLTAAEAVKARKHAIMASGMKSLTKPGKSAAKAKA
jgi:hypothetical protein